MHHLERSVVINRPLDEVFAYTMNPNNNAAWNAWVIESVVTTEGPLRVGTEFQSTTKFLGRSSESMAEITALVPGKYGSIRTKTGPITATGTRSVEAVDGGSVTRFTQTMEVDFHGFFGGIAESLVIRASLRQGQADLQTLKELLEAGVAGQETQRQIEAAAV